MNWGKGVGGGIGGIPVASAGMTDLFTRGYGGAWDESDGERGERRYFFDGL